MPEINCHIPIKFRLTGELSEAHFIELESSLARTLAARIALAERTVVGRADVNARNGMAADVREPYVPVRYDPASGYEIPSYENEGTQSKVPIRATPSPQRETGGIDSIEIYLAEGLVTVLFQDGRAPLALEIKQPETLSLRKTYWWIYRKGKHHLSRFGEEIPIELQGDSTVIKQFSEMMSRRTFSVPVKVYPRRIENVPTGYENILIPMQALFKEQMDRLFIEYLSPARLVEEAEKKNDFLLRFSDDFGPGVQSAIAETLILMFQDMEKRLNENLKKSPIIELGEDGLPIPPEGVSWNSEEFAGIVEGISPFHMIDWWISYIEPSEPVQRQRRRPRRRVSLRPGPQIQMEPRPNQKDRPKQYIKEPSLERVLPPAPTPPQVPSPETFIPLPTEVDWLKFVWDSFKNWALAAQRGRAEAAHDISINVLAAGIASMAMKVEDTSYASVPEPDLAWIKPTLDAWLRKSGSTENARRVHEKGIDLGLKAAKDLIRNADKKNCSAEVRGYITPEGDIIRCHGLDCASSESVVLVPAQGCGIVYLRWLKKRFKSLSAIHGYFLQKLKDAGVSTRFSKIIEQSR